MGESTVYLDGELAETSGSKKYILNQENNIILAAYDNDR